MCIDITDIDIDADSILRLINLEIKLCTSTNLNFCKDPAILDFMINNSIFTIFYPKYTLSKEVIIINIISYQTSIYFLS